MNYLIWKSINSKDIKGLLISELPPITKPKMRVQETKIDGVDGSIIEELGFESYNKKVVIGLSKDFDIDEVIEYFNGEGQVIFSNEPDKYYNAKIIDQIDYERLLRFRTAIVTFRVQPFKYEYQEEEKTLDINIAKGQTATINGAKIINLSVEGKTVQNGNPTPETPIAIESITGKEEDTLEGKWIKVKVTNENNTQEKDVLIDMKNKNLFDNNFRQGTINDETVSNRLYTTQELKLESQYTYTLKTNLDTNIYRYAVHLNETPEANEFFYNSNWLTSKTFQFSPEKDGYLGILISRKDNGNIATTDLEDVEFKICKCLYTEEYHELNSLGDVKDLVVISKGKILLKKYTKRMIFDSTLDGWGASSKGTPNFFYRYRYLPNFKFNDKNPNYKCNMLEFSIIGASTTGTGIYILENGEMRLRFGTEKELAEVLRAFDTNPLEVVYELKEPEIYELGTVDDFYFDNETNNFTVNVDTDIVVKYTDDIFKIENIGNYIAKPKIQIMGLGTIEFILNDNKIFRYTFPDGEDTVVIDSQKQDAYLGTILKNRNMSGEFPILQKGENIITWDGVIEDIKVSQKSRWI